MVDIIKEVHSNRTQYGYYEEELYWIDHNVDSPAVIWDFGRQEYRNHDILHRIGGPAVYEWYGFLTYKYFVNGNNVSRSVETWFQERNLKQDNLSNEDYHVYGRIKINEINQRITKRKSYQSS